MPAKPKAHATSATAVKSAAVSSAASTRHETKEPVLSWFVAFTTYMGYAVLIMFGHLRDFCGKLTGWSRYFNVNSRPPKVRFAYAAAAVAAIHCRCWILAFQNTFSEFRAGEAVCQPSRQSRYLSLTQSTFCVLLFALQGYAPLLQDWENFYTRRLYHRIQDAWNRPIAGPPTASRMKVVERVSHDGNRTLV